MTTSKWSDGAVRWALRLGARAQGLTPNESVELVESLESLGWMYKSERGPTWTTTPAGLVELARLDNLDNQPNDD